MGLNPVDLLRSSFLFTQSPPSMLTSTYFSPFHSHLFCSILCHSALLLCDSHLCCGKHCQTTSHCDSLPLVGDSSALASVFCSLTFVSQSLLCLQWRHMAPCRQHSSLSSTHSLSVHPSEVKAVSLYLVQYSRLVKWHHENAQHLIPHLQDVIF